MASITRRTGRDGAVRYDVRYRDPTGTQRSRTFRLKRDANEFAERMATDLRAGTWVDPQRARLTFADWWATWQAQRVDLRPSTLARDDWYARSYLLPRFGPAPLGAIGHEDVQAWIADLSARGLAPATVVKAKQILSKSLDGAVRARRLTINPAAGAHVPKVEREEMRFLTPDEVATLADTIDGRYRALVLVGAWCGLRLGELVGLRRSRVDLVARRVDVVEISTEAGGRLHTGPPKTKAGRRSVPLPRHVADALDEHTAGMGADALVFTGPAGGPLRASLFRPRFWLPAVRAAGVAPLRIHDLRHTAVALWIAAGAGDGDLPLKVARRAGHASVSTVLDRYGHLLPGTEDRLTDALDGLAVASHPTPDATVRAINVR